MAWVPEPPAMTLGASRVELRVSCHGLLDRDTLAKPHPCVLLKLYSDEQWVEVRATRAWKEGGWWRPHVGSKDPEGPLPGCVGHLGAGCALSTNTNRF